MTDLHPTFGNESNIKTSPPIKATSVFRKRPQVYNQVGLASAYKSLGERFVLARKASYQELAAYDEARYREPIIKQGLEFIALAIVQKVGDYIHPDPNIQTFVRANIKNKIKKWILDLAVSSLWSGFGISEITYVNKIGPNDIPQTWIDDLINYHPLQVDLIPNDFGVLKDGDKRYNSTQTSGVWVPLPIHHLEKPKRNREIYGSKVRLPKYKYVYTAINSEQNNIWGKSLLTAALPYHLYKEAFRDMMLTALDRYGTPLIYAVVPPLDTREQVVEPDGECRPKTLQEMTTEALEDLSSESALVFTQISKDQPVELRALTTGNNFSDSFEKAIDLCDRNMMVGMGIPNLLIRDNMFPWRTLRVRCQLVSAELVFVKPCF